MKTLFRKRVRLTHQADEVGYLLDLPPQCPVDLPA
jgi:hypothetical protein